MRKIQLLPIAAAAFQMLFAGAAFADDRVLFMDTGGHTATIHKLLFTPDGRYLLSVGDDKCVRVWKTATGEKSNVITGEMGQGYDDKLYAAALSPKGDVLAVAGTTHIGPVNSDFRNNEFVIRLLDIKSLDTKPANVEQSILPAKNDGAHGDAITALAFSPDGRTLASASRGLAQNNDRILVVKLWNMTDRQAAPRDLVLKLKREADETTYISSLSFSPDSARIVISYQNGSVYVVPVDHPDNQETLSEPTAESCTDVAWSPDGTAIAASYAAGNLKSGRIALWSGDQYHKISSLPLATQCYSSVAFTRDSKHLLTTSANHHAVVWDWKSGSTRSDFGGHASLVTCGAFDPADDKIVATAAMAPNEICLWDPTDSSAKMKNRIAGVSGVTSAAGWSDDGTKLRWTLQCPDGATKSLVFDLATATVTPAKTSDLSAEGWIGQDLRGPGGSIDVTHLSDDPAKISIVNGGNEKVLVNGEVSGNPTDLITGATSVSLTDDGKYAVVGSRYSLAVYSTAVEAAKVVVPRYLLASHIGAITSVSISPSPGPKKEYPQYVASTSTDGTVCIWSLSAGTPHDTTPMLGANGQVIANIQTLAPVISIFAGANDEWIAWCGNNGYYTSSPQAGDLVLYHFNHGEDKPSEDNKFPVDLRQPEFFTEYLKSGDIEAAISKAISQRQNKSAEEAKQEAINRMSEPPSIKWNISKDDLTQSGAAASLKLTISASIPCTVAYKITVNNHEKISGQVVLTADDLNTQENRYSKVVTAGPIPLRVGVSNLIAAIPTAGALTGEAASVTVSSTMKKGQLPQNLWILAIGVSHYRTFKELNYPDLDAKALIECLQKQEGRLYQHVYTPTLTAASALTDQTATKKNIVQAIDKLQASATENDTVIVFIAGHGGQDESANYYFLPYDVDTMSPQTVNESAIPWSKVQSLLDLPGHVYLFLDTCHAGGAIGSGNDAYTTLLTKLGQAKDQEQLPATVFASCRSGQLSREASTITDDNGVPKPFNHGVFTYALLQALTPSANNPAAKDPITGVSKGFVTPHDLELFLESNVTQYSQKIAKQNRIVVTDLAIDSEDSRKVRSASTRVTSDQTGWVLSMTGGNGFTPGSYTVKGVDESGFIILDRAAGKISSTGGSASLLDQTQQTAFRTGFAGEATLDTRIIDTLPAGQ